jgi:aspartyl-tRNA(Asn)/glutamyl-tRNA(Gln) amidotransferase subunit A
VNPKINAVVTLMAEDALKGADAADKAVASGAPLGPLHGVPFSIKDALDTAGVLTQRGSKLFAGNIPDRDATAVARFKAAGGIPLMKTNLPRVFRLDRKRQSRHRPYQQSLEPGAHARWFVRP